MGDRLLFRRMSQTVVERIARHLGVKLSRRALGEGVSRWLPVIGALGVGAYAYYDTGQVAATAIELFDGGIGDADGGTTAAVAPPCRAGDATAPFRQAVGIRRRAGIAACRHVPNAPSPWSPAP